MSTSTAITARAWGASHQTGWIGLVARMIEMFGRLNGPQLLEAGEAGAFAKG